MPPFNPHQIFYDATSRRWRISKRLGMSLAVFFLAVFTVTTVSLLLRPSFPSLQILEPTADNTNINSARRAALPTTLNSLEKSALLSNNLSLPQMNVSKSGSDAPAKAIGFFVDWDENSFTSLKNNYGKLDEIIPEWLHVQDASGAVQQDDPARQTDVLSFLKQNRPDLPIVALINNYNQDQQDWDEKTLSLLLADPQSRTRLVDNTLNFIQEYNLRGISVDFESLTTDDQNNLVLFMQELYGVFHPLGLEVSQNIPLEDPDFDAKALARYNDFLILMAYDENSPVDSLAGPIASQHWYQTALARRFREAPPEKYIVALGNYGYNWEDKKTAGTDETFQSALQLASDKGAQISFDPTSLNPYFNYTDENNLQHQLWLLDGATVFNQIVTAKRLGNPAGFVLWRMGSEDPSSWDIMKAGTLDKSTAESLQEMHNGYDVLYSGSGEVLRVSGIPTDGQREIIFSDQQNLIAQETINKIPSSYMVSRWGGNDPKKIVLTFDDGPDAQYTPQILDILERYKVPALFFDIGLNANINPSLVQREFQLGNEIGNHTYTHPNIENISDNRFALEMNSTQLLLESITGHKTLLFRPPYAEDIEPESPDQMKPLKLAGELGYYTVAMHIDPSDWSMPGTDQIVQNVISGALSGQGNIVLLHDGGGNRQQTVQALPGIIEGLRSNGFELVSLSALMGKSRDDFMPPVTSWERLTSQINSVSFISLSWMNSFFKFFFLVGIYFGVVRFIFIGLLALVQAIHSKIKQSRWSDNYQPSVSVIIPAFNEARVITQTISSILQSDYPAFEIILVDDGSQDGTFEKASRLFGDDPRVMIYRQENLGKPAALNFGLQKSSAEIIVTLDADTVFLPDTIRQLVKKFEDKRVAAVAGNAKVGNRRNLLTRWQALEYIVQQNTDKRAFEMMNCIIVVPGAVGAWRREIIAQLGGFSADTLAEDTDLTLSIIRQGWHVVYQSKAIGYTEAPETVRDFIKQRFRWTYGTLQAVWKNRDTLGRKKYGALGIFAIPNVFIFQIMFPFISPLMDLMIVITASWALWQKYSHPLDYSAVNIFHNMLYYYVFFLIIDFTTALIPFFLEYRENWTLLIWLPFQRFFYRQLMYYVALKSVLTALRGKITGWNKFDRRASVPAASSLSH